MNWEADSGAPEVDILNVAEIDNRRPGAGVFTSGDPPSRVTLTGNMTSLDTNCMACF